MALINSATRPTSITLVLVDENARSIKKEFIVPAAVWDPATGLIADLKTIRDNLVTAYNAITNALILKAYINLAQEDDTSTLGPANSDITDHASLVLNLSTVGKEASYLLPAPVIGVFVGTTGKNRNIVDVADTDLLAFTEMLSATDGKFTISDGETVTDTSAEQVKSGKRIARKIKAPLPG